MNSFCGIVGCMIHPIDDYITFNFSINWKMDEVKTDFYVNYPKSGCSFFPSDFEIECSLLSSDFEIKEKEENQREKRMKLLSRNYNDQKMKIFPRNQRTNFRCPRQFHQ